jgi:DEAD/DEAH box helicase domain-containing protein
VSSKLGAQIIIRGILGLPIDVDAIPDPDSECDGIQLPETIVEADPVRTAEGVELELYAD